MDSLYPARDQLERQHILDTLKGYDWADPALAAQYNALRLDAITILDAIRYLVIRIQAKRQVEVTSVPDPVDATLGYLPTDAVYEHGFDPLIGGFRADPEDAITHAF